MDEGDDSFLSVGAFLATDSEHGVSEADDTSLSRSSLNSNIGAMGMSTGVDRQSDVDGDPATQPSASQYMWDSAIPGGGEDSETLYLPRRTPNQNEKSSCDTSDDKCRTPTHSAPRAALQSPAHVDTGLRKRILSDHEPTMTTVMPNPFDSTGVAHIVAFGAKPLSPEEAEVLQEMAVQPDTLFGEHSPLASVVHRLFDTIRFQRQELDKVKEAEVQLADTAIEEERRRHSMVQRRRSLVVDKLTDRMRALGGELSALRKEHARCASDRSEHSRSGVKAAQDAEYISQLENELQAGDKAMEGFLQLAKRREPELADDAEPDAILTAVKNILSEAEQMANTARRISLPPRVSATADTALSPERSAEDVELEHYGERLLELERILKATEDRCATLLQEKTDLHLRLVGMERRHSRPATPGEPTVELTDDDTASADLREQLREKEEAADLLGNEVDKLRDEVEHLKAERKLIDQQKLELSLKLDATRTKLEAAVTARADAVEEQKKTAGDFAALTTKHRKMSSELTENTVLAVQELQRKESANQVLEEKLADRERMLGSQTESVTRLSATVERLEKEILKSTEQLAQSARLKARDVVAQPVVRSRAVDEADRLGAALLEKTTALEAVKGEYATLVKTVQSVQEECEHWKQGVLTYRIDAENGQGFDRSDLPGLGDGKEFVLHVGNHGDFTESEGRFLRRLSAKLGCHASSSRELVNKLVHRIERLIEERREFDATIEHLQEQIVKRERTLHMMRSEFSAENSALRAELTHVENDRTRAVADREAAEVRYLEIAKRDDTTMYSTGDDTSQPSVFGSGSLTGGAHITVDFLDTAQWEDPAIQDAIKSLNVLIGSKAALDARNKALKEQLSRVTQRGADGDGSAVAATRAVAIESRTLNEELVGIVSLQQQVIGKLRTASTRRDSLTHSYSQGVQSNANDEDESCPSPKPCIDNGSESRGPLCERRESLAQAADFLRNQLQSMRSLCEERAQSNASLHGVIREMEAEIQRTAEAKQSVETVLQETKDAHVASVSRLARAAGTSGTIEDIEIFICETRASLQSRQQALQTSERRCAHFESRLFNVLAQKCVLSHILYLYVNKYQLDFFSRDPSATLSGKTRFRRVALAVVAVLRARRAASQAIDSGPVELSRNMFINVSAKFDVPKEVRFIRADCGALQLESAIVALKAIPKLEAAIAGRDKGIARLEAAVAALDVPSPRPLAEVSRNEQLETFDYKDDIVERKNDLARRLRAARKERDELGLRLMREKRERQALEARNSKYMAKLASYQRRLGRAKNDSDAQERFYKNAILYLRKKCDHAVRDDDLTDLAGVDTRILLERSGADTQADIDAENIPEEARDRKQDAAASSATELSTRGGRAAKMLEVQIRAAREELKKVETPSSEARDLQSYVAGLEKAATQLRRTIAPATP